MLRCASDVNRSYEWKEIFMSVVCRACDIYVCMEAVGRLECCLHALFMFRLYSLQIIASNEQFYMWRTNDMILDEVNEIDLL
jgi:hypothetical protein